MPRSARLDLPGLLQHVIVRGIERRKIFLVDEDREDFVGRFGALLEETGTECLAWALMSNHFHLLLRPHEIKLANFMRRLLTGYAVSFNIRHRRSGHLFQNRYKSIVCDEEEFLLELVRYTHLNPLRARLVKGLEGLERYPWSGHAVLMGNGALPGQAVEEVLRRFGRRIDEARQEYASFVAAGVGQGRRKELVGGGLRRSLALLGCSEEPESFDDRVLGSGEFVDRLRQEQGLGDVLAPNLTLNDLVDRVAAHCGLDRQRVLRRSTKVEVSEARALVCYLGVEKLRLTATKAGRVLGIGRSGASRAVARGRRLAGTNPGLVDRVLEGS